jgi:type IV pilus assembly protein PilC
MLYYKYSARDASDKLENGFVSAESMIEAKEFLTIKGLKPFEITPRRHAGNLTRAAKMARIAFLRGFASLARAGMSNEDIIDFLIDGVRNGQSSATLRIINRALVGMRRDVKRAGALMGEAMLNQPQLFTSIDAAIADAAFHNGRLPETLEEHANQLEMDLDFEGELKSSITGPMVALIIGLLMFPGIAATLVPVLQDLFKSFHITPPASFAQMAFVSDAARTPWLWIGYAAVAAGTWWANRSGILTPVCRRLPILGNILRARSTDQGARTLGQAYQAGKSSSKACDFAAATVEDPEISRAFASCADDLSRGRVATIAEAMSKHSKVFDPIFIQYMKMARESRVPEMCVHVSANARRQVREAVKSLPIFVNNGATLLIGCFVGLMAFYVYTAVSFAVGHIGQSPDTSAELISGKPVAGH